MRLYRGLGRVAGAALWAVMLAPLLALVPAAVLDRGPGGAVRTTPFPAAMAALDPLVWDCARNSLAMAGAVTLASLVVGVALARASLRWRFWGRRPLAAMACAGVVIPPAFAALGLRWALGPSLWTGQGGWVAWFWVALTTGAPLVAMAAGSALRRVEPAWEDAARLAGASRRRVWRQLVWPVIRPDVARASGVVFTLTLMEPGAPLVLGLRRSLGFQIAEAALDLDPQAGRITRAAVLALAGTALAALGRWLIRRWGGARLGSPADATAARAEPASWRRGAWLALVLSAAAGAVWLPVVAVLAAALSPEPGAARVSFAAFAGLVGDPLTRRFLLNSAALGLAVVALDLVLARAVVSFGAGLPGRLAGVLENVPPLALGVGALALPWVLQLAAGPPRATGSRSPMADGLQALADTLDPDRTPGVLLVLGVAAVRLPLLARSAAERRRRLRPVLFDAAVSHGATPRQARRTLSGRWLGASTGAVLLTLALAATSLTPALILTPTAETRTLAPAVLSLADEPGGGLGRAAALASLAIALNLTALTVAARGRSHVFREWLRG